MLLYGCFNIDISGPLTQYLKKFLKPHIELAAAVPCALFTVDVSQWRGAHSLWPCSVNIVEHSGCSGGSPGALYLNNVILHIDIYIV